MADNLILQESASEWYDVLQTGTRALKAPPANDNYAYLATQMMSWAPERNAKGVIFYPEDISDDLLSEWVGRQVNIEHNKGMVVGNLRKVARTQFGVEGIVEIDRDQAEMHGMDLNQPVVATSVEFTRDPTRSPFIVQDETGKVIKQVDETANVGLRRTTKRDPYLYDNKYTVSQRVTPRHMTGLGLTVRPADKNARVYHMTASTDEDFIEVLSQFGTLDAQETAAAPKEPYGNVHYADPGYQSDKKSRYPLDTPAHVRAAASYFGDPKNRNLYTPAQRAHIDAAIKAAKERFKIGDESASAEKDINMNHDDEVAALKAENAKLAESMSELQKSLKTSKLANVLLELDTIKTLTADERKSLTETASAYVDDDGVIRAMKAERRLVATGEENLDLKKENDTLKAAAKAVADEAAAKKDGVAIGVTPRPGDTTDEAKAAGDAKAKALYDQEQAAKAGEADKAEAARIESEKQAAIAKSEADKAQASKEEAEKLARLKAAETASDPATRLGHVWPVYGGHSMAGRDIDLLSL
jgi:hypothetical protein